MIELFYFIGAIFIGLRSMEDGWLVALINAAVWPLSVFLILLAKIVE